MNPSFLSRIFSKYALLGLEKVLWLVDRKRINKLYDEILDDMSPLVRGASFEAIKEAGGWKKFLGEDAYEKLKREHFEALAKDRMSELEIRMKADGHGDEFVKAKSFLEQTNRDAIWTQIDKLLEDGLNEELLSLVRSDLKHGGLIDIMSRPVPAAQSTPPQGGCGPSCGCS